MTRYLIVVDMQNDFVSGSLGTPEAEAIVDRVAEKIESFPGEVLYTMDTHHADYLSTQEGRRLPVEHCIEGSDGWRSPEMISAALEARSARGYVKGSFASVGLAEDIASAGRDVEGIELVGLCTDICVVSNALLLKAYLPEVPISVDASCCAGTTPERHRAALDTMRSCQIAVED